MKKCPLSPNIESLMCPPPPPPPSSQSCSAVPCTIVRVRIDVSGRFPKLINSVCASGWVDQQQASICACSLISWLLLVCLPSWLLFHCSGVVSLLLLGLFFKSLNINNFKHIITCKIFHFTSTCKKTIWHSVVFTGSAEKGRRAERGLSSSQIADFRSILLFYIDFCQKQNVCIFQFYFWKLWLPFLLIVLALVKEQITDFMLLFVSVRKTCKTKERPIKSTNQPV